MTANIKSRVFYVIMTPFPLYKNMLNFSGWSCSYKNGALLAKFQPGVLNAFVLICGCLLHLLVYSLNCPCVLNYFSTIPMGFKFNLTYAFKPRVAPGMWHQNCHCLQKIHFPSLVAHSNFGFTPASQIQQFLISLCDLRTMPMLISVVFYLQENLQNETCCCHCLGYVCHPVFTAGKVWLSTTVPHRRTTPHNGGTLHQSKALHSTAQNGSAQQCTPQQDTAHQSTVKHNTERHSTAQRSKGKHNINKFISLTLPS